MTPRRVLVVSMRVPTPDFDTASARLEHLLDALLAKGHRVAYGSIHPDAFGELSARVRDDEARLLGKGIEVIAERDVRDHLRAHGAGYDLVIGSYLEPSYRIAPLLDDHAPGATRIFDTVDVHHVRLFRTAKVTGKRPMIVRAMQAKTQEVATVERYDHTIVVSAEERALVESLCPHASVSIVALPYTGIAPADIAPLAGRDGAVFLANYLHQPNEDAMQHYVADIAPRLEALLGSPPPLRIVGSGTNPAVLALDGPHATVVGRVETVAPELARARVYVAPLRIGSGIKGKIVEAMAHGIPVVTTSVGAEGLGIETGRHALVADDPDAFAAGVSRVLRDDPLWQRLSSAGLALVRDSFSLDAFRSQVDDAISQADERRARGPASG
jgi:glycosyltransferase involved in cell wall biosynthesis